MQEEEITSKRENFYLRKFASNLTISDRLNKIFSIFKKYHFNRLLDIGCGDGSFSVFLKDLINEVYGVDIAEEAVELAKKKGIKAYKVNIDEEDLPFKDNFFDAVFCGEVIEHLYDPDHLFQEVHRVLISKGFFILTTPNLASWLNRIILLFGFQPYLTEVSLRYNVGKFHSNVSKFEVSGHIRCFTLKALKELLQLHNFYVKDSLGANIGTEDIPFVVYLLDKVFSKKASLAQYLVVVARKNDV